MISFSSHPHTYILYLTLLTFLYISRSKRYERMRGEARASYQSARTSYNTMQGASAAVNYFKLNSQSQGQSKSSKGSKKPKRKGNPVT